MPNTATGTKPKDTTTKSFSDGTKKDVSAEYFPQLCTLLIQQISKESEQVNQLQQMFATMMNTNIEAGQCLQNEVQQRIHHNTEAFVIPPSQAVKFLSTQIPQFSGTDDDDVNIWLEKIENIAYLHKLSTAVMLSAAVSKLTGNARRWFDFATGETARSWLSFKEAIISRFKMRIPRGTLMRKLEARKWIYSSESFTDYAADKLILTRRLQFSDYDAIHSLIDGITNLSIQAAALALDAPSLDIFLEKMHRMTSSCDTQLKIITARK